VIVLAIAIAAVSCSCKKQPADPNVPVESASPDATAAPLVSDETVIERSATVEGVSLQNLTVGDARGKILQKLEDKLQSVDITVSYEDYDPLMLTADTIGLSYSASDVDAVLNEIAGGGEARAIPLSIDDEKLRAALNTLNEKIPNHAIDAHAEVDFKYNKIDGVSYAQPVWKITESKNGAVIDFDDLEHQIISAIDTGDYTATLTPVVSVSEPALTTEALQSTITLLGKYSTNYRFKGSSSTDPSVVENAMARDRNISKAVGMMQQVVQLNPGERFSFNKTTGDRTEKSGWSLANAVYQGTGYRKEAGGGVCQVSTTIFNAILRAGIRDITRRGHSIPSDYVTTDFKKGLGFDATVDSNHIDFGFKNDTGHTIYMFIYITKNNSHRKNIVVEIYGQEEKGVEYRCSNEILEEWPWKDPTKYQYENDRHMLETEEPVLLNTPRDGYRVMTYVDKYKDGKFVERWRSEETRYDPVYPKYRRGTAKVTLPPTNTPKPTDPPSTPGGE
jgi:vancomycin resistance protein YoaR